MKTIDQFERKKIILWYANCLAIVMITLEIHASMIQKCDKSSCSGCTKSENSHRQSQSNLYRTQITSLQIVYHAR